MQKSRVFNKIKIELKFENIFDKHKINKYFLFKIKRIDCPQQKN